MSKSQEEDEFIAVRVQDPRVQNEGSWNSYVDFKIFLHTNSKAFTAKTSCVRRRYSEFVWLKKKLQKNAGLVPVPDLPQKSYFSFVNDDFIERRRKGLQSFLDRVVHMTVCLSDSQLHLFLQTQLPVKHIEDCVQGHTPYTVTEAILNYASSNRGWVQEEGGVAEELWMAPVPYESADSPAHHLPSIQYAVATSSGLHPPSELTDVSDLETVSRLSDSEQTGSDLKQEREPEQKVQEEDTQRVDCKVSDLQRDGCEYQVQQIEGPFEVQNMQEHLEKAQEQDMSVGEEITSVFEKRTLGGTGEKGWQESTVSTKDVTKEDAVVKVYNNEAILDLSAAQKDNAEEGDLEEAADKTWEDVALDEASTSEENISNTKQQEQSKAEITQKGTIQENGVIQKEQVNETEISETCLSDSESSRDLVGEVNKINAKCVHTDSAILILEGIEEALVMQTAPMTEISSDDLKANTADVNTLVLQAIEVDSMQCQEKDSHIITAQQPDAN